MLELKSISKTFNPGTVNEKCALHDLSLSVPDGDFVTIIGANGAGKSTLFGAIGGNFLTDSGEILLDGQNVTFWPEHRRSKVIGRLFQDPMRGSAPGLTIEEHLALAAGRGGWLGQIRRCDREYFREQLRELEMGLEDPPAAAGGASVRRSASGADAPDGDDSKAQAPSARRAHGSA